MRFELTDEELQIRRELHDKEMKQLDALIALALREARFPSTMMAVLVIALVGPWILSLLR